ncbi:MAG: SulP family sulfate permease [Gammaproteobacteria bacterium]|jgi:SulP family sulfate permease
MKIFSNLRGDIYGGLTTAVVALPLALAFGVSSGAGAEAGLYGAIFVGFFAALFGGTPAQVSGPTGPMTVVMALIITHFAQNPLVAFTIVIMGGAFQILFGLFRFGRYINLVPIPVISGFMSGIGCIIIILQLAPLFGHETPPGIMLVKLAALPALLNQPETHAILLGVITIAIVYLLPKKIAHYLPASLFALVVGTLVSIFWLGDVQTIGTIPASLPVPHIPVFSMDDIPYMIRYAMLLAFLGSIDTLLTSLVADSITHTHHNSDRELIGQGIGNMISGVFGGLPGAGATMRTVTNVRAGGKTPLSGILHSITLLIIVLGIGSMVENIPLAVLAGILLKVGADIIDWRYLRRIIYAPKAGVIIMLTTLTLTVVVDLITAVAAGMVMASLLFVQRMADAQMKSMKLTFDPSQVDDLIAEEISIMEMAEGRIVLFHLEGPMSFGSAKNITRVLMTSKNQDVLIIDLSDVPFIDSSASIALEEVVIDAQASNDFVVLCGLRDSVKTVLRKIGMTKLLPADCIVSTRLEALRKADLLIED